MKEIVEMMARALVDRPQAVSVSEVNGTHSCIVELSVAKEDIGKIIGKQGRTADAMRTIVGAVSAKMNKRSVLEIIG
ncbi:MAG: KH domain-containing protein [Desulfobacterales bacterium]|nr:KH domain-containing protein [Desulfobacterales bacterium]